MSNAIHCVHSVNGGLVDRNCCRQEIKFWQSEKLKEQLYNESLVQKNSINWAIVVLEIMEVVSTYCLLPLL